MGDVTNYPLPQGQVGVKQAINLLLGMAELVEAGVLNPGLFRIAVETQTISMTNYMGDTLHQMTSAQGVKLHVDLTELGVKAVQAMLASEKWQCSSD